MHFQRAHLRSNYLFNRVLGVLDRPILLLLLGFSICEQMMFGPRQRDRLWRELCSRERYRGIQASVV